MTVGYAKHKGLAHAVRVRAWNWIWRCEHCNLDGPRVETRGEANRQAREHNDTVDHTGPPS